MLAAARASRAAASSPSVRRCFGGPTPTLPAAAVAAAGGLVCRRRVGVRVRAMAPQVQPKEAAELMSSKGAKYLDVRTPQEFAAGHVPEAINIPLMLSTPAGMQPNPDFLTAVKAAFPEQDAHLIVGCKSGNRSARACALLEQDGGFTNLVDQTGGWDGHTVAGLPVHKPQ